MEIKLVSNGVKHETVPENYVLPLDLRPGVNASTRKQVPTINLAGGNRAEVANQILSAGKEFGLFQVVDHGIADQLTSDMMGAIKEFFEMPIEDKALYYSEDETKVPRLFTSYGPEYKNKGKEFWRDCLRLVYNGPGDEFMHLYPGKPSGFSYIVRDVVIKFQAEVEGLATRILKLISEGLGLGEDYFGKNNLDKGAKRINVNHYPPCPDPSLTLAVVPHCDQSLITLLLQGDVSGLQVLHSGEWVNVDPIPNAFIVNFGHVMEITTNGVLKSAEHRAVTNKNVSRMTIGTFVMPTDDSLIAPAEALVDEQQSPPLYKSFSYKDFFDAYLANLASRESTLKAFMIES